MSVALHTALLLALSLIVIAPRRVSTPEDDADFHCTIDNLIPALDQGDDLESFAMDGLPDQALTSVPAGNPQAETSAIAGTADIAAPPIEFPSTNDLSNADLVPMDDIARIQEMAISPSSEIASLKLAHRIPALMPNVSASQPDTEAGWSTIVSATHSRFEGRDPARRGEMLARHGGNDKSEAAVTLALNWLANHQRDDGSWRFRHVGKDCGYFCSHQGMSEMTNAATGLALLSFLGAGYTHDQGDYRDVVRRGLFYLSHHLTPVTKDGKAPPPDGYGYSEGIAGIALCEAYGMSRDPELKPYAQAALRYTVFAQDRNGGGWRYGPGQAGDTTVTIWHLMALKTGLLAGLDVSQKPFHLASKFLDSVETGDGAGYSYLPFTDSGPFGPTPPCTAIGVLGRMLTGWQIERPELVNGIQRLAKLGPSKSDMYFNYNATRVMRDVGGETWDIWNKQLREQLIRTQNHVGHASGSWFDEAYDWSQEAGRLGATCLSCLTLEVYYRHMPLYDDRTPE